MSSTSAPALEQLLRHLNKVPFLLLLLLSLGPMASSAYKCALYMLSTRCPSQFRLQNASLKSLISKATYSLEMLFYLLRPGSVIADVQLEVASPNASVVLDVVSGMNNLGNFSLDRNETKMKIEQGTTSAFCIYFTQTRRHF